MERRLNTNRRSVLWQRPRKRTQGDASAYESLLGSAAGQPPSTSQEQVPIAAVVLRNTNLTNHHNSFSAATTTSTMFSSTGTADQAGRILPSVKVACNNNNDDDSYRSRSRSSRKLLPPSRRVDHGDDSPVNSPVHQRPRLTVSTTAATAFAVSPAPETTPVPAAAGIVVSRRADHGDDTPVNSPVHQRPRLTVSTAVAATFPAAFSDSATTPAAGIVVSRLPSRRQLLMTRAESCNSQLTGAEFDSWTATSHTSSKNANIAATFSAAFTATPPTTPTAAGILVSRLPSRRQLLTRTESCNSHSTGAEFDSWLNRSQTSRNTSVNTSFDTSYDTSNKSYESMGTASSCGTSSRIPAAPHLLRLTSQSSARNMMMMMSNSSRSMMSTNSSRSLSSSGTGTSSVPKKRRQRPGRRRDKNDSNSSSNGNGNSNGRRPTNPMALELRKQMSGLSMGTTTTNNGTPGSRSMMTSATAATTMTTTTPMDVADDKRSVRPMDVDDKRIVRDAKIYSSYDSCDSSCKRLLAKCEMTRLVHRKSMSSSGDGASTCSLPSISTVTASVSQQHQHPHCHNANYNYGQPGANHRSAFQRRASM
jgi:hypothetical protein